MKTTESWRIGHDEATEQQPTEVSTERWGEFPVLDSRFSLKKKEKRRWNSSWRMLWAERMLLSGLWTCETVSLLGSPACQCLDWNFHGGISWVSSLQTQTGTIPSALLGLQVAYCRSWDILASMIVWTDSVQPLSHIYINTCIIWILPNKQNHWFCISGETWPT